MEIAIIGAGNVGTTLGNAWIKRGHEVAFGVRDPESAKARSLAQQFPAARLLLNGDAGHKKLSSWPLHRKAPRRPFGLAGSNGDVIAVGYRDALFVDRLYGSGCKEIVPFNGSNSGSL